MQLENDWDFYNEMSKKSFENDASLSYMYSLGLDLVSREAGGAGMCSIAFGSVKHRANEKFVKVK